MSRRFFLGVFEREQDLLAATRAARDQGLAIVDAYTPYAVHGLDEAMGLKPSRLSRLCLAGGLAGALAALWFQFWTMTSDWPLNVGGRPWNSWPAFLPVTFEVMVLFAGFGVVFAFFGVSRLFPGKRAVLPIPEVTTDRFVVVVQEQADFHADDVRRLFQQFQAVHTEEREEETAPRAKISPRKVNWFLGTALVLTVFLNWLLGSDSSRPNHEFLPEMVRSVPFDSYSRHPALPEGNTLQPPQAGTIARGQLPLHYRATPEDAVRAGKELHNPLVPEEGPWLSRGAYLYAQHCQICHGDGGDTKGPLVQRGIPAPPSFFTKEARLMPDGQKFYVLTYGKGSMASYAGPLSRADRWAVILHVRGMQKKAGQTP